MRTQNPREWGLSFVATAPDALGPRLGSWEPLTSCNDLSAFSENESVLISGRAGIRDGGGESRAVVIINRLLPHREKLLLGIGVRGVPINAHASRFPSSWIVAPKKPDHVLTPI